MARRDDDDDRRGGRRVASRDVAGAPVLRKGEGAGFSLVVPGMHFFPIVYSHLDLPPVYFSVPGTAIYGQ